MSKVIVKTASTSLIVVLLGLLGTAAFWLRINADKLRKERELTEQLAGNFKALTDTVRTYKVKVDKLTALNVSIAYRASIETDEYIAKNHKDAELIKKLGIRLNDLQSATNVTAVTHDTIKVDSIVYKFGNSEYLFNSEYLKANVTINHIKPDSSILSYTYKNELLLTNEFQQKRFLFIRYGKKFKTAHIVSRDKNCKIVEFEYKEILRY